MRQRWGYGGDGEDAFHPGEGLADALAVAAAEGEVGEFRGGGFGFGGETVGVEAKRIGEVFGVRLMTYWLKKMCAPFGMS